MKVRKEILKVVRKNRQKEHANTYYTEMLTTSLANNVEEVAHTSKANTDQMENIIDIR